MSRHLFRTACLSLAMMVVFAGTLCAEEELDATALMVRSHDARADWKGFPGFTAEVVATQDGESATGTIAVSASGDMTLELPSSMAWAERKLDSLVSHRFGDTSREYDVSFADAVKNHPLGRLIKINDDALMGSQYRVQDDVIREVHRNMGDTRFTITVIDVARNKDGQYLPTMYTVSYWDSKTGDLKSTSVVRDDWKRVGKWDLPAKLLSVDSSDEGQRHVREIRLTNLQLLEAASTGAEK